MRTALLTGIRNAAFVDDKLREKLCHRYAVLEDFIGQFQTVMETGEMAREEIRRKSFFEQAKELLS